MSEPQHACCSSLQRWIAIGAGLFLLGIAKYSAADQILLYSSESDIYGLNLTTEMDRRLTTSPFVNRVNGLASDPRTGLVYYGEDTKLHMWDSSLGSGQDSHNFIHDFGSSDIETPIENIDSTGGSFVDGLYYVGSEDDDGLVSDIWEVALSVDGRSVISARPLNLLQACQCTPGQLGGFGDIAAFREGADLVIYGSTGPESTGSGANAGRWRFNASQGTWTLLTPVSGGQMSRSLDDRLYANEGQDIVELNRTTGASIGPPIMTVSAPVYDISAGLSIDYGDAPSSYGAASQIIPVTSGATAAYLGEIPPDNDGFLLNDVLNGDAFSGDDRQASDDEDALNQPWVIEQTDENLTLDIKCSSVSQVSGWLDANFNGVFDASERNTNYPVSCASGSASLLFSNITITGTGKTGLRLRAGYAASDVASPIGRVYDGEVEDHLVDVRAGQAGQAGNCPIGSQSFIYVAEDLPKQIGPSSGDHASSNIEVPDSHVITDINLLKISGEHENLRDLRFRLRRDGTNITLLRPSCSEAGRFAIGFDDEAQSGIPCPPDDGQTYAPLRVMDRFDNETADGVWTLQVQDRSDNNAGILESWALEICTESSGFARPDIRLGKSASVNGDVVTFTLLIKNTGTVSLKDLEIVDDLDAVFGQGNYTLVEPAILLASPPEFLINPDFGPEDVFLLEDSGVLPIGAEVRISMSVRVTNFRDSGGKYNNTAKVNAVSEDSGETDDESGNGLDLSTDVDGPTPFEFKQTILLSGSVFYDQSANEATSHDGIRQSSEQGVSARQVSLVNISDNTFIQSTLTDATGRWSVNLDKDFLGAGIAIVVDEASDQFISESITHTAGPKTDGRLEFKPVEGVLYRNLDVGVIPLPVLSRSQQRVGNVAERILYQHEYTAPSHGKVEFRVDSIANPTVPGWPTSVSFDADCNGILDGESNSTNIGVGVAPGDNVCLLLEIKIPSDSTDSASHTATLSTIYTASDAANTSHGVTLAVENVDITQVKVPVTDSLQLTKTVENLSDGTSAAVANEAQPGDTLQYRIDYVNNGTENIKELSLNDTVPVNASLIGGTLLCDVVPSTLVCQPTVSGRILRWRFDGILEPGAVGSVSFRVTVD